MTRDLLSLLSGFQGERLRLARVACARPLDSLGAAVGTGRAFLHACEQGAKSPPLGMVDALATSLGVTPGFFALAVRDPVRPEQCHFRKGRTTPLAVVAQVVALATLLDGLVALLDQALDLPALDLPDLPATDAREVETAAEAARAHWGLGGGPIASAMRVVERAGVVVTRFADLSERVDALSIDRRRPLIVLNEAPVAANTRYDLAHELGHLVMHRGMQTGDAATEAQADRFAGALLLPRAALLHEFPRGDLPDPATIRALAARWGVAGSLVLRRASELGILDAERYRSGLARLGRGRGPSPLPLGPEEPELLPLARAAGDGPAGFARLCARCGLGEGMARAIAGPAFAAAV